MVRIARICEREGCPQEGVWSPALRIWALGDRRSAPDEVVLPQFALCVPHREELETDNFVPDDAWEVIAHMFRERRHQEPDRASIVVVWTPAIVPDDWTRLLP